MKQALQFIEIDMGVCSLTYGTSPCTASIPTTGADRCFNTFATCQDPENYDETIATLRFAEASDYLVESGIEAIPSITSIAFTPAVLAPGEDLGTRASLRITFRDHPHSDAGPGFDPYRALRSYNPYKQGSFWPKFRARFPFMKGEPLRWRMGAVGDTLEAMETRTFVIEGFEGPTYDGSFTIIAKDPLRLLAGKHANAPAVSKGSLQSSIDDDDTAVTLVPAGIGSTYPASGKGNVGGKEVVSFTRSGDNLTLTRAQHNTTAVAHDAGERFQLCLEFSGDDVADIIDTLTTDYVPGWNPAWNPLDEWQTETGAYLRRVYTTLITEPTSVNQLVAELIEQCGLSIFWDDLDEQLRMQVLRQLPAESTEIGDNIVRLKTFDLIEQQGKRISQVWTYFAQTNPLKSLDDKDNYRQVEIEVNLDNEAKYGQPAIKKIWSRWIALGGVSTAQRTNRVLAGRYLTPPRRFVGELFRGAQADPQLGHGFLMGARVLQGPNGARVLVPAQFISLLRRVEGWKFQAEELRWEYLDEDDFDQHSLTISGVSKNLNIRTQHDQVYPEAVAGDVVEVIIQAGSIIGSTSTSTYALRTGTFPTATMSGNRTSGSPTLTGISDTSDLHVGQRVTGTGIPTGAKILSIVPNTSITLDMNATSGSSTATTLTIYLVMLKITNKGLVIGKGGDAGRGAYAYGSNSRQNAVAGSAGGPALLIEYPCDLDNTLGEIWSGGGGGGGAGVLNLDQHTGGPGGGGGGFDPGQPGPNDKVGRKGSNLPGAGSPGTQTAGGQGGQSYGSFAWYESPYYTTRRGGSGGAPGSAGSAGSHHGGQNFEKQVGAGGAAGLAINGVSLRINLGTGDIRGATAG